VKIIRKIYNLTHPIIGVIWCLHRVLPERSSFPANRELEITPEFLELLVKDKIANGYHFVDIDTFVEASRHRSNRKMINVSFDDGFSDVFIHAYPILRKYNIPFTLYLTTDMPDGCADLWWLQLEQLANGNTEWFEATTKQIYSISAPFAKTMHELTNSDLDRALCKRLSLTWEQLQTMVSEGLCAIGSHGTSHTALSLLTKEQVLSELMESKRRIKEMLDIDVHHFSYPHSFYNETTNQLVWQVGCRTAVIGYGGKTRYKHDSHFFYRQYITQP